MSDDGLFEWGGPDLESRQTRLDAAYAERMVRQRPAPGPLRTDALLEGARSGNARLALLWLLERGMAGVGHEPGWPDDEG